MYPHRKNQSSKAGPSQPSEPQPSESDSSDISHDIQHLFDDPNWRSIEFETVNWDESYPSFKTPPMENIRRAGPSNSTPSSSTNPWYFPDFLNANDLNYSRISENPQSSESESVDLEEYKESNTKSPQRKTRRTVGRMKQEPGNENSANSIPSAIVDFLRNEYEKDPTDIMLRNYFEKHEKTNGASSSTAVPSKVQSKKRKTNGPSSSTAVPSKPQRKKRRTVGPMKQESEFSDPGDENPESEWVDVEEYKESNTKSPQRKKRRTVGRMKQESDNENSANSIPSAIVDFLRNEYEKDPTDIMLRNYFEKHEKTNGASSSTAVPSKVQSKKRKTNGPSSSTAVPSKPQRKKRRTVGPMKQESEFSDPGDENPESEWVDVEEYKESNTKSPQRKKRRTVGRMKQESGNENSANSIPSAIVDFLRNEYEKDPTDIMLRNYFEKHEKTNGASSSTAVPSKVQSKKRKTNGPSSSTAVPLKPQGIKNLFNETYTISEEWDDEEENEELNTKSPQRKKRRVRHLPRSLIDLYKFGLHKKNKKK